MPRIGDTVGRIRIESILGRGGMGDVFVGFDETLGRQVALKSIRSDRGLEAEAKARFLREARVLSQIEHSGICQIHDYLETDEGDVLVLELIRGRTLGEVIKAGIDRARALEIARAIVDVLAAAHREGVVHRDLKPSNVMITDDGVVKVLDFGLARSLDLGTSRRSSWQSTNHGEEAVNPFESLRVTESMPAGQADGWEVSSARGESVDVDFPGQDLEEPVGAMEAMALRLLEEDPFVAKMGDAVDPGVPESVSEHGDPGPETDRAGADDGRSTVEVPAFSASDRRDSAGAPPTGVDPSTRILGEETLARHLQARKQAASSGLSVGLETRVGKVVGTPAYMSPEQARGEAVTTASDMYSFGLLLQVLLTGRSPHEGFTEPAAILERVRRGESDPPRGVGSDLQKWIVRLKSASPADRPTAVAMLEGLDVLRAKPRKRARALAIAAVAVLAIGGAAKYTVDLRRERGIAEERRAATEDVMDFMIDDLRQQLTPIGRLDILSRVADKALEHAGSDGDRDISDDERFRRSKALTQKGEVEFARGDLTAARTAFDEALALSTALVTTQPENGTWVAHLGAVHFWIGNVDLQQSDKVAAKQQFENYLAKAERLQEIEATRSDYRIELAYAHSNLGTLADSDGQSETALEHFQIAAEIQRQLMAAEPEATVWRMELSGTLSWIAEVYSTRGELDAALETFGESRRLLEGLVAGDPTNVEWRYRLGTVANRVGSVLGMRGELESSLVSYQRSLQIHEALVREDPENSFWFREAAIGQQTVGTTTAFLGDGEAGIDMLERSVGMFRELRDRDESNADNRRDLAAALLSLSWALVLEGQTEAAAMPIGEAHGILDSLFRDTPSDLEVRLYFVDATLLVGIAAENAGRSDEARRLWLQALATIGAVSGSTEDPRVYDRLARTLLRLGRIEQARTVVQDLVSRGYRYRLLIEESRRFGLDFPDQVENQVGFETGEGASDA